MDQIIQFVNNAPVQSLAVLCIFWIILVFPVNWLIDRVLSLVLSPILRVVLGWILKSVPDEWKQQGKPLYFLVPKERDQAEKPWWGYRWRYVLACLPPILWLFSPPLLAGFDAGYRWQGVVRALRFGIASWYMIPVAFLFILFVTYLWSGPDDRDKSDDRDISTDAFRQHRSVWFVFALVVVGLLWFIPSTLLNVSEEIHGLDAMTGAAVHALDEADMMASGLRRDANSTDQDAEEYINEVEISARTLDAQLKNVISATTRISATMENTLTTGTLPYSHTQQAILQVLQLSEDLIQPHITDVFSKTGEIAEKIWSAQGEKRVSQIAPLEVGELKFLADEIADNVAALQPTAAVLTLNRTTPFLMVVTLFVVFLLIPWFQYLSFILGTRWDRAAHKESVLSDLGLYEQVGRAPPKNRAQALAKSAREAASQATRPGELAQKKVSWRELSQATGVSVTERDLEEEDPKTLEQRFKVADVMEGVFHAREYVIPLVILTLLTFVGWYYIVFPEASAGLIGLIQVGAGLKYMTTHLTKSFTALTMTFAGAWLFMVVMLTYRWVTDDLYPKTYFYASMRLAYALLVGLAFTRWFGFDQVDQEGWKRFFLVVAFFVGTAPLEFVRAVWKWLRSTVVGDRRTDQLAKVVKYFDRPDWGSRQPLTNLEDLNAWDDTRLYLEGIQNVHALATADLVRLVSSTPFDGQTLVDWVDQAALYIHTKVLWRTGLSAIGVRTATDLFDVCLDEDEKADQAKVKRVVDSFNYAQLMSLGTDDPRHAAYDAASKLESTGEELGERATAVKEAAEKLDKTKPETLDNVIALRNEVSGIQAKIDAAEVARKSARDALSAAPNGADVSAWADDGTVATKVTALTEGDPSLLTQANDALKTENLSREKLEEDLKETADKAAQKALQDAKEKVSALVKPAQEAKTAVEEGEKEVLEAYADVNTETAKTVKQKSDTLNGKVTTLIAKATEANELAETLTKDTAGDAKAKLDEALTAGTEAKSATDDVVTAATNGGDSFAGTKSAAETLQTKLGDDLQNKIKTGKQRVEAIENADQAGLQAAIDAAKAAITSVHEAVGTAESPADGTIAKTKEGILEADIYKKLDALEKAEEAKTKVTDLENGVTAANDIASKLEKDKAASWDNVKALYEDLGDLKGKVEALKDKRDALKSELDALKDPETLALREARKKIEELSTADAKKKAENAEEAFKPLSAEDKDKLDDAKEKAKEATDASETLVSSADEAAEEAMRTSLPIRLTEGILETMLDSMQRDPNIAHLRRFWQHREKRAREGEAEASTVMAKQAEECRVALAKAEAELQVHKERTNECSAALAQREADLKDALKDALAAQGEYRVVLAKAEAELQVHKERTNEHSAALAQRDAQLEGALKVASAAQEECSKLRTKLDEQKKAHDAKLADLKEEAARRKQAEEAASEAKMELAKEISLAPLTASIRDIKGIEKEDAQTLKEKAGITTIRGLLEACATPQQRNDLAVNTDIDRKDLLEWANRADLSRIRGVGEEYSDLLEEAGVDTVVELAQRNPENLHAKLAAVKAEKGLVRKLPTQKRVDEWVDEAKQLPRILTYG